MSSQMLTLEREAIVCKALLWQIMVRVGRSCFEGLSDMRHFHLLPLILLAGCGDTGSSTNQFAAEERSEEHTSELQSLMRISYAVFCLKKKKNTHISSMTHFTYSEAQR